MSHEQTPTHVLFASYPGQGHLNPLLRLAKRVAAAGLLVTFSTTSNIGLKIQAATSATPGVSTPIGSGHLRFDFFSDGTELLDPKVITDVSVQIHQLRTVGFSSFSDLLRRQAAEGRPVSYIVNNPFIPWVVEVAAELHIPCAVVWVQSCAVFSTYYHYQHSLSEFPSVNNPNVTVTLPGLPPLAADEIPTELLPDHPYPSVPDNILEQIKNIAKASCVLVNTFEELEHDAIQAISKLLPVIPIGPLIETEDDESQSQVRGDIFKVADCMEWLDAQEPRSVVYVSMGSIVVLSSEEMTALAQGLRDTGLGFLWVVREETESLLPEGFVEETKGKGMVVRWSPQDKVLVHSAVACFMTHCGWNSTLEALTSGVPVVAFPQWGDQMTNAKFLVEVYGVGVRLRKATREEVARRVEEVVSGKDAAEIRRKAAEWSTAAKVAVRPAGSSYNNIKRFVDSID
ncbi:hypothetical protein J5N97_002738 [Dioscorea zingiberensis]|uniref:Glycosyltransferase n=1 Tax=Dioscorea zingiberensis TaxID=325984 RepID=A0A9D5D4P3_9LILI|nr:hypothetical protein J5N97_002738 [Dioscorea zingiberensis]